MRQAARSALARPKHNCSRFRSACILCLRYCTGVPEHPLLPLEYLLWYKLVTSDKGNRSFVASRYSFEHLPDVGLFSVATMVYSELYIRLV
ncbi:hypothetical protein EJ05DRAFT_477852 [Pseudovirgaria hyperparasitica]|uniref:Uncharacterized protein n=1 Tax=Pseudovirgaria hyperparasitica TaxID=470096 RepID=A0A6A6W5D2_9PEZI|nr:uncharacterized protein EJ05DRAFT_477852 [Pseudovirgaria hyperparasitica]KAF2756767.1 hypothetical protein EJ05DRAFT_477852 [Pseudovirgaria hyperparasitica]